MKRGMIVGSPKEVVDELLRIGLSAEGRIDGYFTIYCNGKRLGKGSGIAGDNRWFYYDTMKTAYWKDFRK